MLSFLSPFFHLCDWHAWLIRVNEVNQTVAKEVLSPCPYQIVQLIVGFTAEHLVAQATTLVTLPSLKRRLTHINRIVLTEKKSAKMSHNS